LELEVAAVGAAPSCAGTSKTTPMTAANDRAPAANHRIGHGKWAASRTATTAAESAMPEPTPAKCSAERPGRPARASRSSTSAELKISAKAEATPAVRRNAMNNASKWVSPIAARQSALVASPRISQKRRVPGRPGHDASSAPARYPTKFADAIRPAALLVSGTASTIGGRIGV